METKPALQKSAVAKKRRKSCKFGFFVLVGDAWVSMVYFAPASETDVLSFYFLKKTILIRPKMEVKNADVGATLRRILGKSRSTGRSIGHSYETGARGLAIGRRTEIPILSSVAAQTVGVGFYKFSKIRS